MDRGCWIIIYTEDGQPFALSSKFLSDEAVRSFRDFGLFSIIEVGSDIPEHIKVVQPELIEFVEES